MKRLVIATCAACTAPTVQMSLQVANASTDTSCITGVEVRVFGAHHAQDPKDIAASCVPLTGKTYTELEAAMHDKYVVTIPSSGLAGVEVRGYAGTSPCDPASFGTGQQLYTPDLIFYASSPYIGQDTMFLPVTQNLSCTMTGVNIHVTDLIALEQTASPTDANCTNATAVSNGTPNAGPSVGLGTIVPEPFMSSAQFFGNNQSGPFVSGLARFSGYDQPDMKSCVAMFGGNDNGGSTSCVIANPVCPGSGAAGEVEMTSIPTNVIDTVLVMSPSLMERFPGVLVGSVWTGTTAKHPVTGATVTIDATKGSVLYVDPPPSGSSTLTVRTDQSGTGASGMFLLYTNTVAQVTVKSGSLSRTVTLSAVADYVAGALVLIN